MIRLPLAVLLLAAPLAAQTLTPAAAQAVFQEHRDLARKEGGKLWGRSLEGPMLLADTEAKLILANEADGEGKLQAKDGVFAGPLPKEMAVANTSFLWAGKHWTVLRWPLEHDTAERRILLAHESFHRIQNDLGLWPADMPACAHLETREGRLWLRLELRALRAAVQAKGKARRAAMNDALAFRAKRRALMPDGARAEAALEMAEGLAEYTGTRVALSSQASTERTARRLEAADRAEHHARSFAYATGPALGTLLDEVRPGWRKGLKAEMDVALLLGTGKAEAAEAAAARYGAEAVKAEEEVREVRRVARVAELRKRYVDGPVLAVPMGNISFNPSRQEAHAGLGTYNPTLRLAAAWGVLTVTDGSLMAEDWSRVTVPAPADPAARPVTGPGWTLDLKEGWALVPGARPGDWKPARTETGSR